MNRLFYGDNLEVLRAHVPDASVDLVYLDPPFNSNRDYNVIFKNKSAGESHAQLEAFTDTWTWSQEAERTYQDLLSGGAFVRTADAIEAMRRILGETDLLAYLVMMTPRLIELHRVLKPTGSLYLHCDPTASHYLKIILDAIFGPECFKNEVIWRRTGSHTPSTQYGPIHDVILFYSREKTGHYFQPQKTPYTIEHVKTRYKQQPDGQWKFTSGGNVLTGAGSGTGESSQPWRGVDPAAKNRHWAIPGFITEQMPEEFKKMGVLERLEAAYQAGLIEIIPGQAWPQPVRYLKDGDGIALSDIWAYQPGTKGVLAGTDKAIDEDVAYLGPTSPERLGYPTQKPIGLLSRIISTSCPPDGVVLDPFCGCGTAVDAAQKLGRNWIGIDVTYLAVDLIDKRLQSTYGESIVDTYEIVGIPRDIGGAQALFARNPFDFERWAVSLIHGQPNEKQVGDRGIDGVIRFHTGRETERTLISVKGGKQLNPAFVRELIGAVESQKAAMGVLITMEPPTKGMLDAARRSGIYTMPANGQQFPKVQILTVPDLLMGKRPELPPPLMPYTQAQRRRDDKGTQSAMFA